MIIHYRNGILGYHLDDEFTELIDDGRVYCYNYPSCHAIGSTLYSDNEKVFECDAKITHVYRDDHSFVYSFCCVTENNDIYYINNITNNNCKLPFKFENNFKITSHEEYRIVNGEFYYDCYMEPKPIPARFQVSQRVYYNIHNSEDENEEVYHDDFYSDSNITMFSESNNEDVCYDCDNVYLWSGSCYYWMSSDDEVEILESNGESILVYSGGSKYLVCQRGNIKVDGDVHLYNIQKGESIKSARNV
jgi:hypothetical protein